MASYPPPPPPGYGPPPSPQGYGPPPGYGPPGYGYPPTRTTNGKAIAALVCSLCAFVVCPLIAIAAVILAPQAKREIAADPQRYDGMGLAKAGQIIGWIGIGYLVVVILAIVAIVAFGGTSSTSSYESLSALVP